MASPYYYVSSQSPGAQTPAPPEPTGAQALGSPECYPVDPRLDSESQRLTAVEECDETLRRNLELRSELQRNDEEVAQMRQRNRPVNTRKQYASKQNEFREFCRVKGYADGETVTESKASLFLRTQVIGREIKRCRYKKDRVVDRPDSSGPVKVTQTLGRAGVKAYVNSLVDLWTSQRNAGLNDHPSPRGNHVKALLVDHECNEAQRKRKEYVDRGLGTLLDGYKPNEMIEVVKVCW